MTCAAATLTIRNSTFTDNSVGDPDNRGGAIVRDVVHLKNLKRQVFAAPGTVCQ